MLAGITFLIFTYLNNNSSSFLLKMLLNKDLCIRPCVIVLAVCHFNIHCYSMLCNIPRYIRLNDYEFFIRN